MYKTILICLTSSGSAEALSEIGAFMAEKFEAHLIGVHNSMVTASPSGREARDEAGLRAQPLGQTEVIQQIFEKVAASRRVSFQWRHKELPAPQADMDLISLGMAADLIIAGGRDSGGGPGKWYELPVRLATEAARPVLLIPAAGKYPAIGRNITVAWNRSRESARAIFEALPLLTSADSVRLLAVNGAVSGALSQDDLMPQTLARHGVKVRPVAIDGASGPGDALMADMAENRSDLLVMGCFGRPRLLEMVLGGVTHHVLSTAEVPVLLAH